MLDEPQQNRVVERRNHTLMSMVRSMISYSILTIRFWTEAVKNPYSYLNRVPSKSVPKTLYGLWTGREPPLNNLHVWGCPTEAKVFNLLESWIPRLLVAILLAIQISQKFIISTVLTDIRSLLK